MLQAPRRGRFALREVALVVLLLGCTGCTPGATALTTFALATGAAALLYRRERAVQALQQAAGLRRALESGAQRDIEMQLRRFLNMSEQGGVSAERRWLARAQLGGLLVAEWRLDEAAAVYDVGDEDAPPLLRALAIFGRHEIAVLRSPPTAEQLAQIRSDAVMSTAQVPAPFRVQARLVWGALEGLCLARMGRPHDAIELLKQGVEQVLDLTPARIIYIFHLAQSYERTGELSLAQQYYERAAEASPGTRLASDANARLRGLGPSGERAGFRGMLPEPPAAASPHGFEDAASEESGAASRETTLPGEAGEDQEHRDLRDARDGDRDRGGGDDDPSTSGDP